MHIGSPPDETLLMGFLQSLNWMPTSILKHVCCCLSLCKSSLLAQWKSEQGNLSTPSALPRKCRYGYLSSHHHRTGGELVYVCHLFCSIPFQCVYRQCLSLSACFSFVWFHLSFNSSFFSIIFFLLPCWAASKALACGTKCRCVLEKPLRRTSIQHRCWHHIKREE